MKEIIEVVSLTTGFSLEEITGACQKENLVAARAYIARQANKRGFSDRKIAYALNRDRTAIVHYRKHYKPTFYYELIEQWTNRIMDAL